jgi:hypothetical protein
VEDSAGNKDQIEKDFDVTVRISSPSVNDGNEANYKSLLPVATGKAAKVRDLAISEIGTRAPLDIMARDTR